MLKIYIYVDGSDLDEVDGLLVERFAGFVKTWGALSARLVNDKALRTANLGDEDLPQWNLRLNFEAPSLSTVEFDKLISFLRCTAAETKREFVIGGRVSDSRFLEDLAFIGAEIRNSKIQFLRDIFVTLEES